MRAVAQRVLQAQVKVNSQIIGQIGKGLLVYISIAKSDSGEDAQFIADKVVHMRIFADENEKMNLSIQDVAGEALVVSEFTLHGDCRKGRRPAFDASADAVLAEELYQKTIALIRDQKVPVETGKFAAHMEVTSINDGPVTFLLDSSRLF
ncbi:MAG: D-tyrosyl-tRNA(Tyr) deacylase [Planctomycetes bacterium]|nr:D-tyrosyl-tRNA(Tyr) deacylase [Planctomycetota bacterium]